MKYENQSGLIRQVSVLIVVIIQSFLHLSIQAQSKSGFYVDVFAKTAVSCNDGNDAAVEFIITSGKSPYKYQVSPGGQSGISYKNRFIANEFEAGNYQILVIDGLEDSVVLGFDIMQPKPVSVSFRSQKVRCHDDENGKIYAQGNGGSGPLSYSWSNQLTGKNIVGLGAGAYILTVSDTNNCSFIDTITLKNPPAMSVSLTKNDVRCYGDSTGSITVKCSGGTPLLKNKNNSYYFCVNDHCESPVLTNQFYGLTKGSYKITAIDSNGCTIFDDITLTEPTLIEAKIDSVKHVTCHGGQDGYISLRIVGGLPPYTYEWNQGLLKDTGTLINIPADIYHVYITDINACSRYLKQVVAEPDLMSVEIYEDELSYDLINTPDSFVSESYFGEKVKMFYDLSIDPERQVDSILWELVDCNKEFSNYASKDMKGHLDSYTGDTAVNTSWMNQCYRVTVTDQFGCKAGDTAVVRKVEGNDKYCIWIPTAFIPDDVTGENNIFRVYSLGVNSFHMEIYNKWGKKVFESDDISRGWDGSVYGNPTSDNSGIKDAPFDTFIYYATIKFDDGTEKKRVGEVTVIR